MAAYYNEHDKFAAEWLRALIAVGLIADGTVDERSIVDVRAADLRGFRQCHFFAGIGGWSAALRLAGWPDDRDVWTGSCPCQPFSSAGAHAGGNDPRDLWPVWCELLSQCRPHVVFGEQVEAAIGHGWLDRVCADLEAEGYAVGACGLPAASVGAFHIRHRLWFVADDNKRGCAEFGATRLHADRESGNDLARRGAAGDVGESTGQGSQGLWPLGSARSGLRATTERTGASGFWSAVDWLTCRDGKARPVEPGTFPLAHGVSARVGRLRGYGNAIVPQVAAELIAAYCEARELT